MGQLNKTFSGAAAYYAVAILSGRKVPQTGVTCVRWILTGMSVGVTHAAGSYISSKATGDSNYWGNHFIGGAAAGVVAGWRGPLSMRIHRALGFGVLSLFSKIYVDFIDKHPNVHLPRYGEHNPSPYFTLNHRWMNPDVKAQEKALEDVL
ncbi:hypothetical protein EG68_03414 [Paragonimus skrjabini miyazakii]|uniref:NADH dehydrogenase [ubiquinone] 1 alpha subcomplex subunit 11 n=1 Tax=Paragonimus skrjabini miyazakii TaxID=59628 RepID=A0A8S9Z131_9TREM|nr:hypothetical protein EG68_03414 [Paragonimus skrjabini miyazakii]